MEERKIEYTKSQSNAVNAPVSDMIVSAAAGSGKTAVLTGRLIRFLCGEGDTEPVDISKMLIVTYTKAAALQLKSKISKAIRKEIKKAPENKRLRTQLRRLEKAKISTIHSFCLDVIKDNFLALGLPAGIRVGDAVEIELVMKQCMEDTLDKFCETSETFADFMDNCTVLRDNSLSGRLTKLYSDLRNMREGIEFLRISSEKMQMAADGDISQSDYFKAIVKPIDRNFAFFKKNFISLLDEAFDRGDEGYFKASFDAIIAYIDGWQDAKSEGLSGAYAYLSAYSSPAFKRNAPEDLKQRCSDLKTYFREYINKLKEKLYFGDYKNDCIQSAKYSMALYEFLSDFESHFKKEKIRLGMLDYSDLERYTYDILYTKDGEKSEKAKEIADRISQIYIDECQDINEVQDAIFTAISRNNRFMVGDIKQSIYGFRGAEPSLFAAYRESFDDYSVGDVKIGGKRIFLSENFRSDSPILDFANMIFETLFNNNSGRIPYLEEDALVHAKKEDKDREKPEIVLLDKDLGFDETKYVCNRIKELHESGVAYSDIAIISRKNSILDEAAKYLAEMKIPYSGKESSSIFDSPDVLLLICILNCIDNPAREVYLAGALKSPVFGVTLDELTDIRMKYRDRSLYSALTLYTEEYGFEKGRNFLDTLNELRLYSESKSSDKIIWNIISKT
ncbi:MAG: UvrD-helicase domain-containing protein, partial [Clostridia bacterium]|nr:UvrD-helicase domain-containing protein [Clostridia bacterium]